MSNLFEVLKTRLTEIADVVNRFESEAQRDRAFDLLVASLDQTQSTVEPPVGKVKTRVERAAESRHPASKTGRKSSRSGAMPKMVPVDLEAGDPTFKELVDEKAPISLVDKTMVAAYWLDQKSDQPKLTLDLVYSVYRQYGWRTPADPRKQLRNIASSNSFLNTSDMSDIALTVSGINYVEHGLPKSPKDQA